MAHSPSKSLPNDTGFRKSIYNQLFHGFYGWRILFLLFGPRSIGAVSIGIGTSLFVLPLEQELEISRGATALLFAIGGFLHNASAPLSGALIDRRGPRQVLAFSLIITAGGYVLFSQSHSIVMVYVAWVALISLAAPNVAWNASSSIVNNWFNRRKAQAMSMLGIGSSLGGVLLVPIVAFVIGQWDWRIAALLMAGLLLLFGLPAVLFTKNHPEEMNLHPDGDLRPEGGTVARAFETPDGEVAMKAALGTRAFWTVTGVVVCFSAAIAALNIHMVPMLVSKDMEETTAGFALSLRAFVSIPIMVSAGWLGDKFGRLAMTTIMVLTFGAGLLLLSVSTASWHLWLSVVLLAGSQGLYPLTWAAVGGLFGRMSYATIRGYIMAAAAVGATALPAAVGFLFEWQNSYSLSLLIIAAICGVSATFMVLTPRHLK